MSEFLSKDSFYELFDIEDDVTREHKKDQMRQAALLMHKARTFDKLYKLHLAGWQEMKRLQNPTDVNKVRQLLSADQYGKVYKTRENLLCILQHDPYFANYFLLNEFTGNREYGKDGKVRPYADTDDAMARHYIEKNYGISDKQKLEDAITLEFERHRYHPIKERIEAIAWDGKRRIETMLVRYLGASDDPYTRDVSRIIFHSAILRLYHPGCKADFMPVLIGKQGEGKSTFVRLLNMEDDWFREVSEFEGQRGMEALEGGFICEVSELLALKRTKDANAVKAYLTRQSDNYRKPYAKYVTTSPRQCIFIGTTNTEQFVNDPTGGRRYLPVKVGAGCIWQDVDAFKAEVLQCWAEAYADYKAGRASAIEDPQVRELVKAHQEAAREDDWRIGVIEDYLQGKNVVCVKQIWEEALKMSHPPDKRDSMEISQLMQSFEEWEKRSGSIRVPGYGKQKVWERKSFETPIEWEDL